MLGRSWLSDVLVTPSVSLRLADQLVDAARAHRIGLVVGSSKAHACGSREEGEARAMATLACASSRGSGG
jgi:hypothetical protein